jgi:hypothetical protein
MLVTKRNVTCGGSFSVTGIYALTIFLACSNAINCFQNVINDVFVVWIDCVICVIVSVCF